MTVASETSRVTYTGDNSTPTYAYPFPIQAKTDLRVIEVADGAEDEHTVDTDYTVAGVGDPDGGTITLTAGNLASGRKLIILRKQPQTQTLSLSNNGDLDGRSVMLALDRLAMQVQTLQDQVDRAPLIRETDRDTIANELTAAAPGRFLRINAGGDGLEWTSFAETALSYSFTTDNRLVRTDGTDGLQESGITLADDNQITGIAGLTIDNIDIDGNTIDATSGNLLLSSTSGNLILSRAGVAHSTLQAGALALGSGISLFADPTPGNLGQSGIPFGTLFAKGLSALGSNAVAVTGAATLSTAHIGRTVLIQDSGSPADFTVTLDDLANWSAGDLLTIMVDQDATRVFTIDGSGSQTIGADLTVKMRAGEVLVLSAKVSGTSRWDILHDTIKVQVHASSDAGQTLTTASVTKAQYEDETEDSHNCWATDTFTAPMSGLYAIMATVATTTASSASTGIWRNGTQVLWGITCVALGNAIAPVAATLRLASGDTIDIRYSASGEARLNQAMQNTILISKVG